MTKPSKKTTYSVIAYGILVIVAALFAWKQRAPHKAEAPQPAAEQQTSQQSGTEQQNKPTTLKEYKDNEAGYSFSYQAEIFGLYDKDLQLPFLNAQKFVPAIALVHTIPVEHCGLSGLPEHCTPTTTDISIAFAPLDYSIDTIKKSKIGPDLQTGIFGGTEALYMDMGVEGEGRIDYYLPLGDKRSLWISRSYINEQVMPKYQTAPGFIPFATQGTLFFDIIRSLQPQPPSSNQH